MSQRPPSFDLVTVRWIALGSMLLGASSTLLLGLRFAPSDRSSSEPAKKPSVFVSPLREKSIEPPSDPSIVKVEAEAQQPPLPLPPDLGSIDRPEIDFPPPPRETNVEVVAEEASEVQPPPPLTERSTPPVPPEPPPDKSQDERDSIADSEGFDDRPEAMEVEALPLTTEEGETFDLTLSDAVVLALQHNREVKNAYLEQLLSRQTLASEADKFEPNFTPEITIAVDRDWIGGTANNRDDLRLNARVEVQLPTGASIDASVGTNTDPAFDATGSDFFQVDTVRQDLQVRFVQPLLQGSGTTINRASIEIARLEDATNYFSLKATLADTLTDAISSYRRLLQAQEGLKIQQLALDSARTQVEITQALIEGGRLAQVDLVTPQTQVANREVSVVEAKNRLTQSRLDLLQVLDLDRSALPIAVETPAVPELDRDALKVEPLLEVALANNPEYLQRLLQLDRERWRLRLAEDERRWQLDFEARYRQDLQDLRDESGAWRAAFVLRREFFGNDRLDLAVARRQTAVRTLENDTANLREDLALDLRNRVRDIEAKFRQVELARRATELSRQQLENEREKLRLGVANTRIIDIVNFENDLVSAENAELNAAIEYLNALTDLDRLVGIVLDKWNVSIEIELPEMRTFQEN
ncbi:MAG: TolC family protein [Cyanobacteria bacterium SID2]|nr:TolC family protein [Cyanobacteria bacterium SID2]